MTTNVPNTEIGEVENKIPDTSCLVTSSVLNIKIGEVENKIPDVSGLVKKIMKMLKDQTLRKNNLLHPIIKLGAK